MSLSPVEGQLILGVLKLLFNRKKKKKEEPEVDEMMDLVEKLVEERLNEAFRKEHEKIKEEKNKEIIIENALDKINPDDFKPQPKVSNDDLAGVDFKRHRFFRGFGGMVALKNAPVTLSITSWNDQGLFFTTNQRSVFRTYAFDKDKKFLQQETSSFGQSKPLRSSLKKNGNLGKEKYFLVVDVGNEKGKKAIGRSLLTSIEEL